MRLKQRTKKKSKVKASKRFSYKKSHMALFVIIFATIGTYALIRSQAAVSTVQANLETGDFSQFNMGSQSSNASITNVTDNAYDGTHSGKAVYNGGTQNAYARALQSINWNDGDDVWFGEAVYLPAGYKNAMQGQTDLLRWDNYPSYDPANANRTDTCGTLGGLVIWGSDKKARFVNDHYTCNLGEEVLVGPFDIPEGQWVWFDVHQKLSQTNGAALTEVFMNGSRIGASTARNKTSATPIERIRFGLVAISAGSQTNPLSLWFDRAYIGSSQLGPLQSTPAPTPAPAPAPTPTPSPTPAPVPPTNAPPALQIVKPVANATIGSPLNMLAKATDANGIAKVEFYFDGKLRCTEKYVEYTCQISTRSLPRGTHTVTVKAYDKTGLSSSATINVKK
jgi:hypothetical protein